MEVFFTPCHTAGHVLYLARPPIAHKSPAALFTGDTLFIGMLVLCAYAYVLVCLSA